MGYHLAGFDVIGVDIEPQPRFPFTFYQDDALAVLRKIIQSNWRPAAIHASFPCQLFCQLSPATGHRDKHPDLVTPGRPLLEATGVPWVIENVPRAPLRDPVIFCGPSFGLEVIRHRAFEPGGGFRLTAPPCSHKHGGVADGTYIAFYPSRRTAPGRRRPPRNLERDYRSAMGVDWMTMKQMRQAIPPAYTRHVGEQMLRKLLTE